MIIITGVQDARRIEALLQLAKVTYDRGNHGRMGVEFDVVGKSSEHKKLVHALKKLPKVQFKIQESIQEEKLTPAQEKKREEIVRAMKDEKSDLQKRYGDDWESALYAIATKKAKEVAEEDELEKDEPEDKAANPKKKEDDTKDYSHKYANDQEYMRVYNESYTRDEIINTLATTDLSIPEITDLLTQLADKNITEETMPTEQFRRRIEIIKALNIVKT